MLFFCKIYVELIAVAISVFFIVAVLIIVQLSTQTVHVCRAVREECYLPTQRTCATRLCNSVNRSIAQKKSQRIAAVIIVVGVMTFEVRPVDTFAMYFKCTRQRS